MASRREERQEEVRLRVMRLISCEPEMPSRKVADIVGISNGSAFYILAALVDKGFLKLRKVKENPGKVSYAHLLTSKGIREKLLLTNRFIERKRQEFEDLRVEIEILEDEVGYSAQGKLLSELKK